MNHFAIALSEDLRERSVSEVYQDWAIDSKPSPLEKKIYERIGVPQFRSLLMNTIGKLGSSKSNYHIGLPSKENLQEFVLETLKNESKHSGPAILSFLGACGLAVCEQYATGAAVGAISLLHGYPTMLQRYNRHRVMDVLEKRYGV